MRTFQRIRLIIQFIIIQDDFVLFRGQIDSKQCRFKVKKTTIEILAKKLIPVKWLSLEKLTHEGKGFSERDIVHLADHF